MAHPQVLSKTDGDLHPVMEVAKRSLAHIEDTLPGMEKRLTAGETTVAEIVENLKETRSLLKTTNERLDRLDAATRGDRTKHWQSDEEILAGDYGRPGWHTRAYKKYGEAFGVSYRMFTNGYKIDPRDEDSVWGDAVKRAPDQHGEADAAGAVVVPEQVLAQVSYILGEKSLPRLLSTIVPMVSDTARSPVLDSGPIVKYTPGQGQAPATSALTFSKKMLTAKTLMALNIVSLELTEDSVVAYQPFWAQVFTDAFALKECKAMLVEDPANPDDEFEGAVKVAFDNDTGGLALGQVYRTSTSTASSLTFEDIVNLETGIDERTWDNAVYFVNRTGLHLIRSKRSGDGVNAAAIPIFHSSYQSLGSLLPKPDPKIARATSLMGDPCYVTAAMPTVPSGAQVDTPILLRANPNYHFFGDRMAMAIRWSSEAAFSDGSLVMRARERYASTWVNPRAIGLLASAAV